MGGLAQALRGRSGDENIVLKNDDLVGVGGQAGTETRQMRLENSPLAVGGMFIDDDEFHAIGQSDALELRAGALTSVWPLGQGNAVNPVESVPGAGNEALGPLVCLGAGRCNAHCFAFRLWSGTDESGILSSDRKDYRWMRCYTRLDCGWRE